MTRDPRLTIQVDDDELQRHQRRIRIAIQSFGMWLKVRGEELPRPTIVATSS